MEENNFENNPINLVYIDNNNSFKISEEGKNFLKLIKSPIAILGIIGNFKTGKSFLLNKLFLNNYKGFNINNKKISNKKGLWVWGNPIKGKDKFGNLINILIIDFVGLENYKNNENIKEKAFSLSIWLSSLFIYNSMNLINENSIKELSFLLNIIKSIQINSNQDENDYNIYSKFFPDFIWILRDINFKLIGEDGKIIKNNDYLQKVLNEQKSEIEIINKIKKLIINIFKEKNCFPLEKPLLNNNDLSNLNNLEKNELNSEFLKEIFNIKKYILNNCKIKQIKDYNINGEILILWINYYLDSINNNKIINIENIWNLICEEQNKKLFINLKNNFIKSIKEEMESNWPTSKIRLKNIFEEIFEEIIEEFKNKIIGKNLIYYINDIKLFSHQFYKDLKTKNIKDFNLLFKNYLSDKYKLIEKKLKEGKLKNFIEYEKDINNFQLAYQDFKPNGPNKEFLLTDFLKSKILESCQVIIENINFKQENDINKLKIVISDKEKEINILMRENIKDNKIHAKKYNDLNIEYQKVLVNKNYIEDRLKKINNEKNDYENRLKSEYLILFEKLNKNISNYKTNKNELEEKVDILENQIINLQSLFEQDKELLKNKIKYYKQNNQKYYNNERIINERCENDINDIKKKLLIAINNYNENLKLKDKEIDILDERLINYEEDFINKNKEIEILNEIIKNIKIDNDKKVNDFKEKINYWENELKNKIENNNTNDIIDKEVNKLTKNLNEKNVLITNKLKEKENEFKKLMNQFETENNLLIQKNKLLNDKIDNLNEQNLENKKIYETTLEIYEGNSVNKNEIESQIKELKNIHDNELNHLKKELENEKNCSNKELFDLNEKIKLLENENLYYKNDKEKIKKNYIKELKNLEKINQELKLNLDNINNENENNFGKFNKDYNNNIKKLEKEIEEIKISHDNEIKTLINVNENDLKDLKKIYEKEKIKFENNLIKEKDILNKKIKDKEIELKKKFEEEKNNLIETLDLYESDNNKLKINLKNNEEIFKHDIDLKSNLIENLNEELTKIRDELDNLKSQLKINYDLNIEKIKEENKILKEDNLKLKNQSNNYYQEICILKQQNEDIKNDFTSNINKLENIITKKDKEINDLKINIEDLKKNISSISNQFIEEKLEKNKEIALLTQHNGFNLKKLEELKKWNIKLNIDFEDKINSQKEEILKEFENKLNKLEEDKKNLLEKLSIKKKKIKDIENDYNLKIQKYENEKILYDEKYINLENQYKKIEIKYNEELEDFKNKYNDLNTKYNNEIEKLKLELDEIKIEKNNKEKENNEIISKLEKDNLLIDAKNKYNEKQIIELKQENNKKDVEFKNIIDKINNISRKDKLNYNSNKSIYIDTIETKYKSEINQIKINYEKILKNKDEKIIKLKNELQIIQEKIDKENEEKNKNLFEYKKKLELLTDNEDKYKQIINDLKLNKKKIISKFEKNIENEKQNLINKINDLELDKRELIQTKKNLINKLDKKKTHWELLKEELNNKIDNLEFQLLDIEKTKEKSKMENERLKNQNRNLKLRHSKRSNLLSSNLNFGSNHSITNTYFIKKKAHYKSDFLIKNHSNFIEKY